MASPKKYAILAKIETTQFTDAVPTAAANSILAKNLRVTPLRVESEDRNLMRPYFGNSEQLPVMTEAVIEFDVEMQSSGTLGTAPKWGPLMRACGFAEVIVAVTSVTYNPISTGFEYVTIYAYRDGVLYKMLGCHGTMSWDMGAKKIPHFHFRFIGKYTAVTDAAIPGTTDYSGFLTPSASIPSTMGTVTYGGFAAKLSAFTGDMGTEVSHAVWMNNETLAPTDRNPKGSLTVEAVTVATKDYFADINAATLSSLVVTQGTVATKRVTITCPKTQLVDIDETDFTGTLAYKFNCTFNPNAGNDEVSIACT